MCFENVRPQQNRRPRPYGPCGSPSDRACIRVHDCNKKIYSNISTKSTFSRLSQFQKWISQFWSTLKNTLIGLVDIIKSYQTLLLSRSHS